MVRYEWDVETVQDVETVDVEAGEVLDHNHVDSYGEALFVASAGAPAGTRYEIVLVRDSENDNRGWAYVGDPHRIGLHFYDAAGDRVAPVPVRFRRELERAARLGTARVLELEQERRWRAVKRCESRAIAAAAVRA